MKAHVAGLTARRDGVKNRNIAMKNQRSTTPTDKLIGKKIRELRILSGISQDELGRHLGVSFQQVQKYEAATNRVSISTMISIAEKFKCSVSGILGKLDSCDIDISAAKASITLQKNLSSMSKNRAKLLLQISKEFAGF